MKPDFAIHILLGGANGRAGGVGGRIRKGTEGRVQLKSCLGRGPGDRAFPHLETPPLALPPEAWLLRSLSESDHCVTWDAVI